MDKANLAIAGLVAGILGVVVGGVAYMKAGTIMGSLDERLTAIESAESAVGPAEIRKAVRDEIAATKADLKRMVAEVRDEIRKLEEQAQSSDILLEAKSHADANAERSSENLMTQVKALQAELATGDQKTQSYYDELKADLEKKIKESNDKLLRITTRWQESGAM